MNRLKARIAAALIFAGAFFLFGSASAKADDAAATFKSKCVACHGADGSGNTSIGKSMHLRDLGSADVQKQSDADLTAMITNGKGAMPSYKGKLTDDQIHGLVTYIRTLKK